MDTFERILKAREKKEREAKKKKSRDPYLGETDRGRAIATGTRLITEDMGVSRDHSSWQIREYKAKPGCVKGRGNFGGIRKPS